MTFGPTETVSLKGRRILLVEDEAILTLDISMELEDVGATVLEAHTLSEALDICANDTVDCAILDVDLRGRDVFDVADILTARGVPFLFHTGHGKAIDIAERFPGAPVVSKPAEEGALGRMLSILLAPSTAGGSRVLEAFDAI